MSDLAEEDVERGGVTSAAEVVASPDPTEASRSGRWAAAAFGVYLLVALVVLLRIGSYVWFSSDEWGFLVDRRLTDVDDLLRPQWQHWSTVPIIAYQVLYRFFGLRSYLPYQACTIVLYLTLAVLVRMVMRRAGVGPWMATIVASILVLFGPGYENIFLGVQISMMSTMVLGYAHLMLADHDGPVDRRDWFGLLAGLGALMASGIALILVAVVGLAVLIRRGWRMALFHTVPLLAIYGAWFLYYRSLMKSQSSPAPIGTLLEWTGVGMASTFRAIGHVPVAGAAIAAVLVGGLVLAWRPLSRSELRRTAAVPLALLVGAPGLFVGIALTTDRWLAGPQGADKSHYIGLAAAMVLPAVAVASDAVVRRWRVAAPVLVAALVVAMVLNVGDLQPEDGVLNGPTFYSRQRQELVAIARSPIVDQVSPSIRPEPSPWIMSYLNVGFVRRSRDRGKLPDVDRIDPAIEGRVFTVLALGQRDEAQTPGRCRSLTGPTQLRPARGDTFVLPERQQVSMAASRGSDPGVANDFNAGYGRYLRVEVDDLNVAVSPRPFTPPVTYCATR